VICQLLTLPRQPFLPLEGEDVAHVPVQHGPHHEDGGVICLCRTPKEREEDNNTEIIGMSAIPSGHPGAELDLAWKGLCRGMANTGITTVGRSACCHHPGSPSVPKKGSVPVG